jgi:hypothetical protein
MKSVPDTMRLDTDRVVQTVQNKLRAVTDRSVEILSKDLLGRERKPDDEIIALLWTVDSHELGLKDLENEISSELSVIAVKHADIPASHKAIEDFINRDR